MKGYDLVCRGSTARCDDVVIDWEVLSGRKQADSGDHPNVSLQAQHKEGLAWARMLTLDWVVSTTKMKAWEQEVYRSNGVNGANIWCTYIPLPMLCLFRLHYSHSIVSPPGLEHSLVLIISPLKFQAIRRNRSQSPNNFSFHHGAAK